MRTIKETIMKRDNITEEEADDIIKNAKEDLEYRISHLDEGFKVEDICMEHFRLEPDYLLELLE